MDYKDILAGKDSNNFWHSARRRLIRKQLQSIASKNKSGRRLKILNVGAGTGDDLPIIKKFGDVYVIDIDKNALKMIKDCYEKKHADVCKLPYEDGRFDIVLALDVLEHIENDKKAMSEIYRVLKKDGNFFFTVPAFQSLFGAHDKALDHKRRYSVSELRSKMPYYKKIRTNYWNSLLFPGIAVMRYLKRKSKPGVEGGNIPKPVNAILEMALDIDTYLVDKVQLPFGLTIVGICNKR